MYVSDDKYLFWWKLTDSSDEIKYKRSLKSNKLLKDGRAVEGEI
jgi:hypothetical protein